MFCSECGTESNDSAKFCMECGRKLHSDSTNIPPAPETTIQSETAKSAIAGSGSPKLATTGKKSNKAGFIFVAVVTAAVALAAAAGALVAINDGSSSSSSTSSASAKSAEPIPLDEIKRPPKKPKVPPIETYTPTCDEFLEQAQAAAEKYGQSQVDYIRDKAKAAGCKMKKIKSSVKATKPNAGPSNTKAFRPLDGNVSYRWVKNPNCSYGSCVQMRVKAEAGCSGGLYMEVNWVDKNNTVVDWTNDSVPSLAPNQKAVLTFTNFLDGTQSAQIADWTCRL